MIVIVQNDNDDGQAKPCINPSKKQLRRHLSSAELTNTAKADRDYDPTDHHSQQGIQRPQSLERSDVRVDAFFLS